jgi:hypothetical protein
LNNACFSPIAGLLGGFREILFGYDKQYLSYLQAHMGHIVASLPQGVRAANLSEGEGRVGVVIVGAKSKDSQSYDVGSKLNMAELGLPKIQGEVAAQARDNLQAIGSQGAQPWPITFSFSRAVQDPAMKAWGGKDENVTTAQTTYFEYTKNASLARQGKFTPSTDDTVDMAATATQDS